MKACPKCNEKKKLSEFYPHKGYALGVASWCKTCCQAHRSIKQKKRQFLGFCICGKIKDLDVDSKTKTPFALVVCSPIITPFPNSALLLSYSFRSLPTELDMFFH